MNYMVVRSIFWFVLAGLMEIGGGYLMWLWLREKKSWYVGLAGALVLVGYGIVPTFQPAHFGRVYAAYGGIFITMALLWGWYVEGQRPDRWDAIGALFCLIGVAVMMYAPRGADGK